MYGLTNGASYGNLDLADYNTLPEGYGMELKYRRGVITGTIQIDVGDELREVFSDEVLSDAGYATDDQETLGSAKIIAIVQSGPLSDRTVILSFRGE